MGTGRPRGRCVYIYGMGTSFENYKINPTAVTQGISSELSQRDPQAITLDYLLL